ncbi:MAG: hypothetical protein HYX46_03640 [Betaproteobacteria bacterium]|nr:hypothetical protein [Betaproteobacteria bacterium]
MNATTTSLHVQRAALAPTNRDLSLLLHSKFGRDVESFRTRELQLARVVFAQVALMAGAALVADTETFVGAEQLWRDMQDRIGPQERALAKHFLELLSRDEYYSATERKLIGALATALVDSDEQPLGKQVDSGTQLGWVARFYAHEQPVAEHEGVKSPVRTDDATPSIRLDDATTPLHVQRAALAPSNRELALLLNAEYGRGVESFKANELEIARVVFAQVALMAGAALAADTETYVGAEQLWRDMLAGISPRERAMAHHFLELLSKDEYYLESERKLIGALSAALAETEQQPLDGLLDLETQPDCGAGFCIN